VTTRRAKPPSPASDEAESDFDQATLGAIDILADLSIEITTPDPPNLEGEPDAGPDLSGDSLVTTVALNEDFGAPLNVPSSIAIIGHLRGTHPHAHTVHVQTPPPLDSLLDALPGAVVHRSFTDDRSHVYQVAISVKDAWISIKSSSSTTIITTYATTRDRATELTAYLASLSPTFAVDPGAPVLRFIHTSSRGVVTNERRIISPAWDEIAGNYTAQARKRLDWLMGVEVPDVTGRLILLHGPAGTGKTTAIRSLARAWSSWCTTTVVLDPEQLLTNVDYLQEIVLDDGDDDPLAWNLYVIEDFDEIITASAKDRTGQALSRLLNVTDGIVGQGLQSLFLITTNEPIAALHDAITRPGRCLENIHVDPLTVPEANAWLTQRSSEHRVSKPTSLATLYGLITNSPLSESPTPASSGQYL
jgi:hypothetical protein